MKHLILATALLLSIQPVHAFPGERVLLFPYRYFKLISLDLGLRESVRLAWNWDTVTEFKVRP